MTQTWLVAGLGNPGPRYADNRHNVGHMVLDVAASRVGATFRSHRSQAVVAEVRIGVLPVARPRLVWSSASRRRT